MIIRRPFTGEPAALGEVRHPVGLPLEQVAGDPVHTPITWHYLSLYLDDIAGLTSWPADRLHLATVEHHVREYGDGFRSLFLCEDCRMAACNATGWN